MSFTPVGSYYLVAILVAVLLALLMLGPARDKVSIGRRRVLIGLRVLVILLVLLAMLRPTIVHTEIVRQSATVVVLADRSRSMQVADVAGKKSRWEAMASALEDVHPALRDLRELFEVKLYTFDGETFPIDIGRSTLDLGPGPVGQQTAIGAALDDVLRREAGKRLAGVILLSDGAQRVSPPRDTPPQVPARRLADLGYPLYTVPLGQARGLGQARDLAIEDLLVPQQIFVKNRLDVQGTLRVEGFVNQELLVQMLFETSPGKMEAVSASRVQARQDGQRLPIQGHYVPEQPGEYKVTLRTPALPGEMVTTNNEMSTFVTVRKGGLSVLYIEGAVRVEQKFIRRSLDPSPDIKVDYVRIDARRKETRPPDLKERFRPGRYDVYIFGDIDAQAFDESELAQLAKTVNDGAGFMMLGGEHSFGAGGYGQTPLADVLPIHIDRFERQNFDEPIRSDLHLTGSLHIKPTPIGQTQSLMQLSTRDKNNVTWSVLPPLDGANRFRDLKPGAQMLAESDQGQPLLVAKDYGAGRVLAFAGDSTWRWWLKGFAAIHRRFWRQTILWLARKDESTDGNVWIAIDRRRYGPGERVEFRAGANAPDGTPVVGALLTGEVQLPGGSKGALRLRQDGAETVGMFLDAQASGDYTIRIQAAYNGQVLGSAQSRFLVYEQDRELENPAADRGALENLAMMTGGRALAPEQLPELLEQLKHSAHNFEVETQARRTLWDTWPFFLAFIGLLIVEWFLRKRWGLV